MASVLFSNIEDGMCSLIIDGEEFIEEEGRAVIPKAVLKQLQIEDIPDDLEIEVCESKDSSMITVSVPMSFIKIGRNEFQVIYDENIFLCKIIKAGFRNRLMCHFMSICRVVNAF